MDTSERAAQTGADAEGPRGRRPVQAELRVFVWKVLIVIGAIGLLYVIGRVARVLLLVFAGVLLSLLLQKMTAWVQRWSSLPRMGAFGVVLVVAALAVGGGGWLLGASAAAQYDQFTDQINEALKQMPEEMREHLFNEERAIQWVSRLPTAATAILLGVGDLLVTLFIAVYMAASPGMYRRGLVLLVPPAGHKRAHEVLDLTGEALWKWMIGQFVSMLLVGLVTGLGLWAIGVPAAVPLGIIAGIFEFIPLIGPIIAAVPAVLIAFAQSPETALWTALLYILIQQLEGNAIQPIVQKRVVDLPPVITIAAVAAGGLLFGILGMFLATPLAVVVLVLVNTLYIEDRLGEERGFPD